LPKVAIILCPLGSIIKSKNAFANSWLYEILSYFYLYYTKKIDKKMAQDEKFIKLLKEQFPFKLYLDKQKLH